MMLVALHFMRIVCLRRNCALEKGAKSGTDAPALACLVCSYLVLCAPQSVVDQCNSSQRITALLSATRYYQDVQVGGWVGGWGCHQGRALLFRAAGWGLLSRLPHLCPGISTAVCAERLQGDENVTVQPVQRSVAEQQHGGGASTADQLPQPTRCVRGEGVGRPHRRWKPLSAAAAALGHSLWHFRLCCARRRALGC